MMMWVSLFLVVLYVISITTIVLATNNNQCVATSGTGQYILLTGSHNFLSSNFGQTFVQIPDFYPTVIEYWYGCSVDESGQHMTIGSKSSGIWYSKDFGQTWTGSDATLLDTYISITTNAIGDRLASASSYDNSLPGPGVVYFSSNGGETWIINNSLHSKVFIKIISDSTGQYLAAIGQQSLTLKSGILIISDDFGKTWLKLAVPYDTFTSITCDATGQLLTITGTNANYLSKDRGAHWETIAKIYPDLWYINFYRVSASASGKNLLALTNDREVFVSSDFGQTWGIAYNHNESWRYGANSADFKVLVALTSYDVTVSRDAGATWTNVPLKV